MTSVVVWGIAPQTWVTSVPVGNCPTSLRDLSGSGRVGGAIAPHPSVTSVAESPKSKRSGVEQSRVERSGAEQKDVVDGVQQSWSVCHY